jgi:FAD/FMN-containing dehydrogenase
MKGVHVDPEARVARANGGVLWGEFDRETQLFGLATAGGRMTTTGVGGFTLGGGYAWISPKHGLACDNLMSAQVVTAEGRVVTASEDENADLLWGLRGGGGNFGVVTSYEFKLHELGPIVMAAWSCTELTPPQASHAPGATGSRRRPRPSAARWASCSRHPSRSCRPRSRARL